MTAARSRGQADARTPGVAEAGGAEAEAGGAEAGGAAAGGAEAAGSYYGRPIIKEPVWRGDIPAYFFAGGLAAGSALLAAGADLAGLPGLRRVSRATSLGAVIASAGFLIHDLGRPARFLNMLRVAKPTSPMSTGTWILAAFGPAAGVAAAAEAVEWLPHAGTWGLARRILPTAGRTAGLVAAGLAPALGTYTAVLIADTAVPSWHEAYPELPFVFAGSALASAAGAALIGAPAAETRPARRLVVAGAAIELAGANRIENRRGMLSEPYRVGRAGRLLRLGRVLTAAGVAGAVLGRHNRIVSAASGALLMAAGVATRFGIVAGGVASARDPRYTVEPQRERLAHRSRPNPDRRP